MKIYMVIYTTDAFYKLKIDILCFQILPFAIC